MNLRTKMKFIQHNFVYRLRNKSMRAKLVGERIKKAKLKSKLMSASVKKENESDNNTTPGKD